MEKVYAEALDRAVSRGEDETKLVEGLLAHLAAVGRGKLLPGILRELRARKERKEKQEAVLEIADKNEEKAAVTEAKALGIEAKQVRVNEKLISGWRVQSASALIDRSGKRALIDIYKNIVTK